MVTSRSSQDSQHLHRIDKFKVPPPARGEFLAQTRNTQQFLSTLPGFVKGALFEQLSGPGSFNFVTLVEWEGAEAVEAATRAVTERFKESGFNPQEFRSRLGIEADAAIYLETTQAAG